MINKNCLILKLSFVCFNAKQLARSECGTFISPSDN